MAFQQILLKLVLSTKGALGAIFADFYGDAVQVVGERPFEAGEHDLAIVGAYQGITMQRLRDICTNASLGEPIRFGTDFTTMHVLSCDLKDGYYLVLILDPTANEGVAWHHLMRCRDEVLHEM